MSGHRPERVGDRVRAILARVIQEELRDPRVGFVTVTGVELSPDLKNARVFVSVLGADHEPSLQALNGAAAFLRRRLAREASLRFTPYLRFLHDKSLETGMRVNELLEKAGPVSPAEEPPADREPGPDDGELD